jgi:hypothetical protein
MQAPGKLTCINTSVIFSPSALRIWPLFSSKWLLCLFKALRERQNTINKKDK